MFCVSTRVAESPPLINEIIVLLISSASINILQLPRLRTTARNPPAPWQQLIVPTEGARIASHPHRSTTRPVCVGLAYSRYCMQFTDFFLHSDDTTPR